MYFTNAQVYDSNAACEGLDDNHCPSLQVKDTLTKPIVTPIEPFIHQSDPALFKDIANALSFTTLASVPMLTGRDSPKWRRKLARNKISLRVVSFRFHAVSSSRPLRGEVVQ